MLKKLTISAREMDKSMIVDSAKPLQGYQGSEEFLKMRESRQGKATFKLAQPQQ